MAAQLTLSEVACRDVIRQARVTRVKSRGLQMLRRVDLDRSESGAHNVFRKMGQSIDVKISKTDLPNKGGYPFVKFTSWLRYLVEYDNLECLVGVQDVKDMKLLLTTFWQRFEELFPTHVITTRAEGVDGFRRCQCIPVLYHGDEGRSLKRKALMVLSSHGALGKGTHAANSMQSQEELGDLLGPLRLNMIGNTFCNHFLQCVIPVALYQENPEVLTHMLDLQATEFSHLFWNGEVINGDRYFIACVGVKGDSPFLSKSGCFDRAFTRRPRAPSSRKPAGGICHLCVAGKEDYAPNGAVVEVPFEELGVEWPAWRSTVGMVCPYSTPSPLLQIPNEVGGDQASLWKFDLFHNFHSGVGKYFASSAIIVCLELVEASIDESFRIITDDFLQWCSRNQESPYHRKITKALLGVEHSFQDCPDAGWSKGDFTRLILQWFGDYASREVVGKTVDPLYLKCVSLALV